MPSPSRLDAGESVSGQRSLSGSRLPRPVDRSPDLRLLGQGARPKDNGTSDSNHRTENRINLKPEPSGNRSFTDQVDNANTVTDVEPELSVTEGTPQYLIPSQIERDSSYEEEEVSLGPGEISVHSETDSESHGQHVVQAVLEADLAMQEMMAATATTGHGSKTGNIQGWYNGHSDNSYDNYDNRRLIYFGQTPESSSLTDSAKEALRKSSPRHQAGITHSNMLPSDQQSAEIVNIQVEHGQDSDSMVWVDVNGDGSVDYRWRDDQAQLGETGQDVEVVEHNVSRTTYVLNPSAMQNGRMVENPEDDNLSWHSGSTEPEPEREYIDTRDLGTQTLRHRKTQTPESVETQTYPSRRRRLPSVPGSNIYYDEIGDYNSDEDGDVTNPGLLHTVGYHSSGSFRLDLEQDPEDSRMLNITHDLGTEPRYLKGYEQYMASFDSTMSGDVLPRDSMDRSNEQLQDVGVIYQADDNSVETVGPNQQLHREIMPQRDDVSMPQSVSPSGPTQPTDSSSGAAGRFLQHSHSIPIAVSDHIVHDPKAEGVAPDRATPSSVHSIQGATANVLNASHGIIAEDTAQEMQNLSAHGADGRLSRSSDRARSANTRRRPPSAQGTQSWQGSRDQSGSEQGQSWDSALSAEYQESTGSKQDFSQQTPSHQSTQTPLKIRLLGSSRLDMPRGLIALGDPFVSQTNGSGSLDPWSLISSSDLDICTSRDFATQTFGQYFPEDLHTHAMTQTRGLLDDGPKFQQNGWTQTESRQASETTPAPDELLECLNQQLSLHQPAVFQPEPQLEAHGNLFAKDISQEMPVQAALLETQKDSEKKDQPPLKVAKRSNRRQMDTSGSTPRSNALRDLAPNKDIQEGAEAEFVQIASDLIKTKSGKKSKKKSKQQRNRSGNRSRDTDTTVDFASDTRSTSSRMSRKDLLKLMLSEVKSLRRKLEPAVEQEQQVDPSQSRKARSRSRGKKTSASKGLKGGDSDSAIESAAEGEDGEKLYSSRRLELLYRAPKDIAGMAGGEDGKTHSRRHRRRHSIESLHSEDGDRRYRSHERYYDELTQKYIPTSGSSNQDPRTRSSRRDHSQRRSVTPPPIGHGTHTAALHQPHGTYKESHLANSGPPPGSWQHHAFHRGGSSSAQPSTLRPRSAMHGLGLQGPGMMTASPMTAPVRMAPPPPYPQQVQRIPYPIPGTAQVQPPHQGLYQAGMHSGLSRGPAAQGSRGALDPRSVFSDPNSADNRNDSRGHPHPHGHLSASRVTSQDRVKVRSPSGRPVDIHKAKKAAQEMKHLTSKLSKLTD